MGRRNLWFTGNWLKFPYPLASKVDWRVILWDWALKLWDFMLSLCRWCQNWENWWIVGHAAGDLELLEEWGNLPRTPLHMLKLWPRTLNKDIPIRRTRDKLTAQSTSILKDRTQSVNLFFKNKKASSVYLEQ